MFWDLSNPIFVDSPATDARLNPFRHGGLDQTVPYRIEGFELAVFGSDGGVNRRAMLALSSTRTGSGMLRFSKTELSLKVQS